MTEPQIGDRVSFRAEGATRTGVVTAVLMAGRKAGTGIHRLRKRVRVLYTDPDGHRWETHRDIEQVSLNVPAEQSGLFDVEGIERPA